MPTERPLLTDSTADTKEAYGMVGADNAASLAMCRRLGFTPVRDVVDATAT
ncbi:hypothetical protein [Streptomyces flaveolus]|uniref:hypothetical protein n=1 Tax=Streptomyces flaveolus TaxID=67297 RepID=UPI0033EC24C9